MGRLELRIYCTNKVPSYLYVNKIMTSAENKQMLLSILKIEKKDVPLASCFALQYCYHEFSPTIEEITFYGYLLPFR